MWFSPDGTEMKDEDWQTGFVKCLIMLLSSTTIDIRDYRGEPVKDDTFLLMFNG